MLTIVSAIIVFGILIGVHEAGHLIAAKAVGVTVFEFAIGMGPKLFSFTKGGTKYSLRLLPLGGFCRMDGEDEASDNEGALCNKPVWARMLVVVSGAVMNILLGFVVYVACISAYFPAISVNEVSVAMPGSPAYFAGIETGDRIVEINGDNVYTPEDISFEFLTVDVRDDIEMTVKRDGEKLTKTVKPALYIDEYKTEDGKVLGGYFADENTPEEIKSSYGRYIVGCEFRSEPKTFFGVLKSAFFKSRTTFKTVIYSLKLLISGNVGLNDVSGPVGIVNQIGSSAESGLLSLLMLMAMITINLGIFNLLPIPALDGGRLLFLIIELIRRKPIPPEREGVVHFVGLALLMILMLVVTANDIFRIVR